MTMANVWCDLMCIYYRRLTGFCALLVWLFVVPLATAGAKAMSPVPAQFVICDDGSVDFGIAAQTGALRYYRVEKGAPLIEYISLNEGELAQVSYADSKWKYGWTDGKLQVCSGKVVEDLSGMERDVLGGSSIISPVIVAPENGEAEFEIQGKLISNWTETMTFSNCPSGRVLGIRCRRTGHPEVSGSVSFSVKFMRWIAERNVNFIAVFSDGRKEVLLPEKKVVVSKVLVSFPENGRRLELTASASTAVTLSKNLSSIGGNTVDFDMGDSSDFKVEIADIAVAKTWQAGNLKLGVNKDNGTSFIMVGGLPLLSVEAFEGEAAQALTGMLARPAWTIEGEGDLNARVKAVGKIYNNWKEVICCATNDTVSYAFETPGKNDDGILLKFPYWLVGCPCEVVLPDGGVKVASGRIPLRIGAAMSFGEFKEGYGLLIWLTNTEQLFLTFESPFLIKSYRGLPDGVEKRHFPESLHSFQPGGLELRPRAKTYPRFTVKYRQFCRQVKHAAKTQTNDSAKESRDVCISQTDGVITVSNSWWEVLHDQRTGGLMSSVKFKGASGENILAAPEKLYLMVKETEFSSFNDRAASFIIDGGSLIVKGKLTAGDGTDCGVVYMTRYDYSDVCVKRRTVFSFAKAMKINRLGVLRLDFIPALDECGYKPVVAAFRKAVFPGPSIVNDMGLGHGFLTVFKSGGEGMDFVPGAETRQWTTQINVDPADRVYRISENDAGGASIIIEPCSNTNRQTQIKNCICFDYYLGLPKLGRKLCKQYFPIRYEPWWFIKRDWVDGKVIRDAAEAGVTLAVDGNFGANWVGEPVPTNFSENEKKSFDTNKKRVEAWHQNNVKVVPFVGKGLIQNSMLPEPQKLMLWGKMGKDLKIEPTPWGAPMMCHCSEEFDRYYKKILCGWVDAFLFDGFYFDFCEPQGTCYNFNHARFPHSDVDGFLRFMQWSHSEFEVVYGHTGYYPTVMCENLVNLTWVGEEVNFWYSNDGRLPSISQMRDYFCHIPNTQRVVDPHIMASWRKLPLEPLKGNLRYSGTDSQEFTCRMALCGLFSEANMTAACPLSVKDVNTRFAPWLKAFSAFKGVDFTTLEFKDWKNQNAVVTGNACVKAAVYWNSEVVYLVLGNPESITRQACKFKLNVKSLGWCDENRPFELSRLPESKGKTRSITYAAMTDEGVPENLDAFEYCVYRLRPISQKR